MRGRCGINLTPFLEFREGIVRVINNKEKLLQACKNKADLIG